MTTAGIREAFISFFEERDHLRVSSASLVPPSHDPSVLLTTAGMQPFMPYFRGEQRPPHPRLTSCQKCFRTTDIENVGMTARHLTFFEMLGNFSVGDYFKQRAVEWGFELAVAGFGFNPDDLWITVFGGDEELGLGPDEEAIACWRSVGVPDERIVLLGREDNFWQPGPTGPCGPCSELYLDRGLAFGGPDDRPGDDTERFLEFWNLVFTQYELHEHGPLTPLPQKNIDTGLGLERLAAILQDVPSVYETDGFRPLVAYGEERSGRSYGQDEPTTRALRILADHGRAMTMLLADGVVPSNESRGYVLRRIMRRAVLQARVLEVEGDVLPGLCERVIEVMGGAYGELRAERQTIVKWARDEEHGFLRTLAQGERLLGELVERARADATSWVAAEDAFRLHDTYGFPYELTKELLAEQGLSVDEAGFHELMDRARDEAREAGARRSGGESHERVLDFSREAGFSSHFVGYGTLQADTVLGALVREDGHLLAKLPESPFYPEGGGQVSDSGAVSSPGGRGRVTGVYRVEGDQVVAIELEEGDLQAGEPVHVEVDRASRLATMANHTATHLLHAVLRRRLGSHVRQAGSYVGPDKLRFDFTHGERLSPAELHDVEEQVNAWILEAHGVGAVETTRAEAERLGAMALFGEKYGDVVRMVEIEDVSRELCGGTHVSSTAEIGLLHVTAEASSASNVRRIEALTGPAGVAWVRGRTQDARDLATLLRVPAAEIVPAVERLAREARELARRPKVSDRAQADQLVGRAQEVSGVQLLAAPADVPDAKGLLELSDQVKQRLGVGAVVLGTVVDGRVHLVANVAPAAVERGLRAGELVRTAAQVVGGGGGGRDTMAQAGGRDPGKLPDALAAARVEMEKCLA